MKINIYILVLIVCFSCKKKHATALEKEEIKKDSTVSGSSEDTLRSTSDIKKDIKRGDSIYKWFKPEEISSLDRRTVKAENGLNIRDSLGNKIGKLVFGQDIYILDYSKEVKDINDNEKTITGRTAKIVTKWSNKSIKTSENSYKHNWYVLKENIGYVFDGFLYKNNKGNNEDSLYDYGFLVVGEKGEDSKIDLSELLDIEEVSLNRYKNRIINELKFKQPKTFIKENKTIELPFNNGEKLVLKDSTYQSEYNPTKSYGVFYHKDFPNSYIVTESMFFMPNIHTELSIKTGDTLNKFNGYPYISPNKKYAVLVTHDLTECYHDTYFEVHKKELNGIYKSMLSFYPTSWSYPFKKNNQSSMDDVFTINWLSDNEFIINAVDYIEDCYDPEQLSKPYYLKFKIKI
ncbi:hypothetical protein [uncultured Lacinutrix sp.]|uniref:hypothetical protein n=1 Tax=uncultured Lacinutrix sp. TaxID=574032 RepID=UPI00261AE4A6|nr:hypothetical protein [uncultured Lacinutrix sp.]